MKDITFQATLARITTTIDGGWRVSVDVSQSDRQAIMDLSELRQTAFQVGVVTAESIANYYTENRSETGG